MNITKDRQAVVAIAFLLICALVTSCAAPPPARPAGPAATAVDSAISASPATDVTPAAPATITTPATSAATDTSLPSAATVTTPEPIPSAEEQVNRAIEGLNQDVPSVATDDLIVLSDLFQAEDLQTTDAFTAKLKVLTDSGQMSKMTLSAFKNLNQAKGYVEFAKQLKMLANGTHDDRIIPNACRTAGLSIPVHVGPPFWWYVISFHEGEEGRACFVRYDTQDNVPSLLTTENCDWTGIPSFTEPTPVEIKSVSAVTTTLIVTDTRAAFYQPDSFLPCPFDPAKALITGNKQDYDEFWIQFRGAYTGSVELGQDKVVRTLASYHDPAFGSGPETVTALSIVLLPSDSAEGQQAQLQTTLNGVNYLSKVFTLTAPRPTLTSTSTPTQPPSFDVGFYFKGGKTDSVPSKLIMWVQRSDNTPREELELASSQPLPNTITIYGGGFGAIAIGGDLLTSQRSLPDFLVDEVIFDPGPGRGGVQ